MRCETIIVGAGTAYPLNGILTLPAENKADEKFPAVVFVHGSGSSNMDEKVGKMTPFKDLAEGLAERGIASIRYDKRSFAHGRKMLRSKEMITVKGETIDDAIAAADLLRQDHRIDAEKVFIIGHSMGGMLAPRIDAEGGNFRGLILMAGSPRKMEDILIEQTHEMMDGMNPLLKFIAGGQIRKLETTFDGLYELSDEEAKSKKIGGGTTLYYFRELANHPVSEALDACRKPMLIMQGSRDAQVSTERDYALYRELLADRDNVEFRLYDGLNHVFVPSIYGTIDKLKKEYSVEQHIGADVIADIAEFVHRY